MPHREGIYYHIQLYIYYQSARLKMATSAVTLKVKIGILEGNK